MDKDNVIDLDDLQKKWNIIRLKEKLKDKK